MKSLFYELNKDLKSLGDSSVDLIKFLPAGYLYKSGLLTISFWGTMWYMIIVVSHSDFRDNRILYSNTWFAGLLGPLKQRKTCLNHCSNSYSVTHTLASWRSSSSWNMAFAPEPTVCSSLYPGQIFLRCHLFCKSSLLSPLLTISPRNRAFFVVCYKGTQSDCPYSTGSESIVWDGESFCNWVQTPWRQESFSEEIKGSTYWTELILQ